MRKMLRKWLGIAEIEQVLALEVRSRRRLRDELHDALATPEPAAPPAEEKVVKGYGRQPADRVDAGAEQSVFDAV